MKIPGVILCVSAAAAALGGCSTAGKSPLPTGAAAYQVIPENADLAKQGEAIQAGDRLAIRVFGEPELTGEQYVVDTAGYIQVPLLGELIAGGQTPRELALELQRRLSARYVRDASVTVAIVERSQATFTVEGDVTAPGVYPATATTTLLTAMAQAKSPTKTAMTNDVIVFRKINGQRAGGRFNLIDIRRGRAADPQILAGDTIVVMNSALKSAWRDTLAALPLLNTFILLRK